MISITFDVFTKGLHPLVYVGNEEVPSPSQCVNSSTNDWRKPRLQPLPRNPKTYLSHIVPMASFEKDMDVPEKIEVIFGIEIHEISKHIVRYLFGGAIYAI